MISACRLVGFKMTLAKLSVYIEADGFDRIDGTPLVRITGEPHYSEHPVRIKDTVDLRARPMWDSGWSAKVRVTFDLEQFSLQDVGNLMMRVGRQVGIGEGRPDSRNSAGMGWGLFDISSDEAVAAKAALFKLKTGPGESGPDKAGKAMHGKAWRDMAGQDKADKAGKAWLGVTRHGRTMQGRQGGARPGMARLGSAGQCKAGAAIFFLLARRGVAGAARLGPARRGKTGQGKAGVA
jgi:hypothetical protein